MGTVKDRNYRDRREAKDFKKGLNGSTKVLMTQITVVL